MDDQSLNEKWTSYEVVDQQIWHPELLSLRIATGARGHQHGQFIRIGLLRDGELISRPYSLISRQNDIVSELLYNIVDQGQLTPRLAQLKHGDQIYVSKLNYGNFTLDEIPDACQHLWCCGTGTGIGPFLPMLEDPAAWRRFEQVVVLYGVRRSRDLAYHQRFREIGKAYRGRFHYRPVISGEAEYSGLRGRITTLFDDHTLEQNIRLEVRPEHSHFMLCGNQSFIDDMRSLLIIRGLKKNLRRNPGQITTERYWG